MTSLNAAAGQAPYDTGFAITPNDAVDLSAITRALFVGGAGSLRAVMFDGTLLNFSTIPAGTTLKIRVNRVHATGTTATGLVGLR